jgi:phospholipid/cholesterol/gamma-HCH transport system permease protein
MSWYKPADVGFAVRSQLADIGPRCAPVFRLLIGRGTFRRFGLVRDQMHFLGNYSLAIIAVSGCLSALCLGCRVTTPCSAMVRPRRWVCWSR